MPHNATRQHKLAIDAAFIGNVVSYVSAVVSLYNKTQDSTLKLITR